MSTSTIPTYQDLSCPVCPSVRFVKVVKLRHHPTNGMVEGHDGYRCAACNCDVDAARLVDVHLYNMKKAELAASQAELDASQPPPVIPEPVKVEKAKKADKVSVGG